MSKKVICIVAIVSILLFLILHYVNSSREYEIEMNRIETLEKIEQYKQERIRNARLRSTSCHVGIFDNPRDCFVKSFEECKWSTEADRCNKV
jgi:penicillin-binding protein-related factor A (putative recombinase)